MSVLDNLKAANATGTARGTFPIIKNSANGKMKNLKLFGASTKAEGKIESVVLNSIAACRKNLLDCSGLTAQTTAGITFTPVYENGLLQYINVNGTATANAYYNGKSNNIKSGSYVLTGFENPQSNTFRSYLNSGGVEIASDVRDNGNFNITNDSDIVFVIKVSSGVIANNDKCYPMIRPASISDALYEPYKANIANLPEAIEMNGIGELKDYIDYDRGVFVQKFGVIILNGSENWGTYDTGSGKKRLFATGIPAKANVNNNTIPNLLCSHYNVVTPTNTFYDIEGITISTGESPVLYLYDDTFNTSDISLWKAHLAKNPVTVVYELAEPIETPLSPAALLELNKLRTFDSITCVSNDAGAEMEIEYFKNNATGQAMSDIHAGVPRFVLDGTTLNIIV